MADTAAAEPKKEEKLSPEREAQEVKLKDVEINLKQQELVYKQVADKLDIERMEIEIDEVKRRGSGWNSPISQLIDVAKVWTIDNERTIMSEPVLKSIWNDDEMEEIKSLILKKAKNL